MHTYRKAKRGWQAGFYLDGANWTALGQVFDFEWEAAAYASFLNGGRYCPDEIEPLFPREPPPEEDDSTHPDRPKALDDYPQEGTHSHKRARA